MRGVELARMMVISIACSAFACSSTVSVGETVDAVEGTVQRVQGSDADLSVEGGQTLHVTLHPVLASQLHEGDRIRANVRRMPDGTHEVGSLEFVERAPVSGSLATDGAVLAARDLPTAQGTVRVGAGQDRVTVLTFLFTSCGSPTMCPLLASKLAVLQDRLPAGGRIVSVTLDPDNDTLDRLEAYGAAYGARSDMWTFARLDKPELTGLLEELQVMRAERGGTILHDLHLLILNRDGRIMHQFNDNTWNVDEATRLVKEICL